MFEVQLLVERLVVVDAAEMKAMLSGSTQLDLLVLLFRRGIHCNCTQLKNVFEIQLSDKPLVDVDEMKAMLLGRRLGP